MKSLYKREKRQGDLLIKVYVPRELIEKPKAICSLRRLALSITPHGGSRFSAWFGTSLRRTRMGAPSMSTTS